MIKDLIIMNGYGMYVWSAFIFTLVNFFVLYLVTEKQLKKESYKFAQKYQSLNEQQFSAANKQSINKIFARNTIVHKI